jgi:hypothetical protein
MKNEINNWHVASIMAPGPRLGGALEVYRGWTPCMVWCGETFASNNWRYISEGVFEFRQEQDLTAFLLRWS